MIVDVCCIEMIVDWLSVDWLTNEDMMNGTVSLRNFCHWQQLYKNKIIVAVDWHSPVRLRAHHASLEPTPLSPLAANAIVHQIQAGRSGLQSTKRPGGQLPTCHDLLPAGDFSRPILPQATFLAPAQVWAIDSSPPPVLVYGTNYHIGLLTRLRTNTCKVPPITESAFV